MDFAESLKDLASFSHAYMIEGGERMHAALLEHLRGIGFEAKGNPDAFVRIYESFGIDEAHEIAIRSTRKPVSAVRNIFVITTPSMTTEAQNTLLKTFEEPASVTTFFLVSPSLEAFLPTLRSRMQLLAQEGVEETEGKISVPDFLAASPAKRLKQIEPLLKERRPGDVIAFLGGVEKTLALELGADPSANTAAAEGLRAVYRAQRYSRDKGALLKVLLEQVALLSPRM